ncbi:MAG: efp, elongation factor elongation factor [Candidatus Adlerbacteria bacterium]|nr:efp, elongation factor elongation factor [Candidatus Adlerbacteria bacterium]
MLEYNEILNKKVILFNEEPYEVLDAHVFRKQQRKPVNQTKLRNLITGKVTEQAFHVSEKVQEADLSTKQVKYMYTNKGEFWFCAENNPADRFAIPEDTIGDAAKFMKINSVVEALVFDERIIGVRIPIKVELVVKEAPPAVKGNTAQGGNKQITLETGAVINAPLFINEGDVVRINTEVGEYVERVDKK